MKSSDTRYWLIVILVGLFMVLGTAYAFKWGWLHQRHALSDLFSSPSPL